MTYFASTKESVVLHFMDTVATIIFALAAVAFAWDASAVEAGLFTFTTESSDGSASYIFNMVPKAELPEDKSLFAVQSMAFAGGMVTCLLPSASPQPTGPVKTVLEEKAEQANKIASELTCMKARGEDGAEVELCPGKSLKKTLPTATAIVMTPSSAGLQIVSWNDGSVLLSTKYANSAGKSATVMYRCVIATDAERSLPPNARAHVGKVVFKQEDEWLVEVHHRDAALCSLIPSATQLMATLKDNCFTLRSGWWDYSVCVNGRIRQYHVNDKGAITDENSLGEHAPASGDMIIPGSLGRPTAIGQLYNKGSVCELINAPRKTLVRFECAPEATTNLKEIREVSTCAYEAIVQTPAVCEHPMLKPAETHVKLEPLVIQCAIDE